MRIGIDCRTILNPGYGEQAGVGHYTYYLVKNLLKVDKKNKYVLFFDSLVLKNVAQKLIEENKNASVKFFPFHQYKHYLPFAYSHILVAAAIGKEKLDVYHAPAFAFPLMYSGRTVVTIHDLAIFKHPEWFPNKFLGGQAFSTKILIPQSLKRADKIIAVSKNTKKDIEKIFKIPREKIEVIYEGVEFRDFPQKSEEVCGIENKICEVDLRVKYGLKDKYILFLGTIEPRKNIISLVKAFYELAKDSEDFKQKYQLAIAGAKGWKYEDVFAEIKRSILKLDKKETAKEIIKYLGYVPAKDKFSLMKHAACFIFPSLYEGFGLPVLEALSLGVPTITSLVSSLPEVAGEAAILINPNKVSEIKSALRKVLEDEDLRKKFSRAGIVQAKKFSWEKCAEETVKVYDSVVQ